MARGGIIHLHLFRAALGTLGRAPADTEALVRLQSRRLRGLLDYACRFSPYYRELFDRAGLNPSDVRTAQELPRLPVLEKAAAREQTRRIASREVDLNVCPRRTTNGTSGTPFAVPVVRAEDLLDALLWAHGYMDCGFRPWRRQAKIALPFRMPRGRYLAQRFGMFRRNYISSTDSPAAKLDRLRALKPDALVCWAGTLNEISAHLEQTDAYLHIPRVFCTSEMLWPEIRRCAERRLHADVTDVYASIETGPIAWECREHNGYHVRSDQVIVEILDEGGNPARQGRVVCTVLWRRAFPLIRYAVGDIAEWADAPCPCGSPYPLIRNLLGRDLELVTLPDGTRISGVTVRTAVFDKPGVAEYQFVQEAPTRFLLWIVPGPAFDPEVERAILDEFRQQFGQALELRLIKTREIRRPPELKFTAMVTLDLLEKIRARGGDVSVFFEEARPPGRTHGWPFTDQRERA